MAKSSKTLSGPSLGRFFRRFYQAQSQLDKETAERLTRLSVQTFAAVQLRRIPWAKLRASTADASSTRERATAKPSAAAQDGKSETSPSGPAESQKFDPYSFGLVPIYQREGREGLIEKLSTVGRADHLRKMARAQQIVLPAALRTGDIDPVELREAITTAVEKRIANRRAAAG
ncbi:MAG: hypothetical protein AAF346_10855 [Pseudomonadota bacterium]